MIMMMMIIIIIIIIIIITRQGTNYELTEDDTIVSERVGM